MLPDAHSLPNGLVVMFEGIDGAGKTTQIELVRTALEAKGWPVLTTRNLGGTSIGEALREVVLSPVERPPLTDFYVSLAIQEPLLNLIDQARKDGKIVLMDRGPLSLAAYQVYGEGIDSDMGLPHVERGMERIKPEGIILYNTDVQTALDRKREIATPDYFERKSPEYFEKVVKGYHETAKQYEAEVIDGTQSVDAIQRQTLAAIAKLLG